MVELVPRVVQTRGLRSSCRDKQRKKRKGRRGVGLTGVRFGVVEIIGGLVERGVSRVGGRRYVMVDLNWWWCWTELVGQCELKVRVGRGLCNTRYSKKGK